MCTMEAVPNLKQWKHCFSDLELSAVPFFMPLCFIRLDLIFVYLFLNPRTLYKTVLCCVTVQNCVNCIVTIIECETRFHQFEQIKIDEIIF